MNLSLSVSTLVFASLFMACGSPTQTGKKTSDPTPAKGTFGYDLNYLQSKDSVVVLRHGEAQVIVSPKYQGKVFTSTAEGTTGQSFGWINYKALGSDSLFSHINAYGGEDRMWLGPEGGQFSVFFKPGAKMTFENWQTPAGLDSEPWKLVTSDSSRVSLQKDLSLVNYSGTSFQVRLNRDVKLMSTDQLTQKLGISVDPQVKWVGFESKNTLTNIGKEQWTKEKGTLCIWVLGMLNPSDSGTVVIPYVQGDEKKLGKIATTNYFGEIPANRLKVENGMIYFKVDGKFRSKLGLSPNRALSLAASYDAKHHVLTVISYAKPEKHDGYINQLWEIQKDPFSGDVLNSYNDGPLENGSQLGPFYELETSSPAAFLSPGESMTHTQAIFHFVGNEDQLSSITQKLLGISIQTIRKAFGAEAK